MVETEHTIDESYGTGPAWQPALRSCYIQAVCGGR